jgi:hypothetical protein
MEPQGDVSHVQSDKDFVNSTPVKQVLVRDTMAAPFTVSKGTPARYASRLQTLRDLILQLQLENDPELLNELVFQLSMFIDEFQTMHIDIVKLKNHLELIRERELDLANSELEQLREQHEAFVMAASDAQGELGQQVEHYRNNLGQLRATLENFKDKELDLATSELSDLQMQWENCMAAQDSYLRTIASQSASLLELTSTLHRQERTNEEAAAENNSLRSLVC